MNRVAVYGTLKEGFSNYALYLAGMKPAATLIATLPFAMFDNDEYPMLVPAENGDCHRIHIEVFEVDDDKLRELDALEAPYGYWRQSVVVPELDGEEVELYFHPAPPPPAFRAVADGDWQE